MEKTDENTALCAKVALRDFERPLTSLEYARQLSDVDAAIRCAFLDTHKKTPASHLMGAETGVDCATD